VGLFVSQLSHAKAQNRENPKGWSSENCCRAEAPQRTLFLRRADVSRRSGFPMFGLKSRSSLSRSPTSIPVLVPAPSFCQAVPFVIRFGLRVPSCPLETVGNSRSLIGIRRRVASTLSANLRSALALARRANLPLKYFKCAWFDERNYFEFVPLKGVYHPVT